MSFTEVLIATALTFIRNIVDDVLDGNRTSASGDDFARILTTLYPLPESPERSRALAIAKIMLDSDGDSSGDLKANAELARVLLDVEIVG